MNMDNTKPTLYSYTDALERVSKSASLLAGEAAIPINEGTIDKFSDVIGKLLEKIEELL
jgi:hypothetical protein